MGEIKITQQLQRTKIGYHDLILRIVLCAVGTHVLIVYGETKSTFEILLTAEYYYAFLGSFIIALLLFSVIRLIQLWLDKRFDWQSQALARAGMQLLCGLVVPGIFAFLLAALYFQVRAGINILKTSYLRYDFQFIIMQLLLINVYYITYYFYCRWVQAEKAINNISSIHLKERTKDIFTVAKGDKNIIVPVNEIAYFFREVDNNYLRTITGEDFFVNQSLEEIQQQLPQQNFFRVNRQVLLHRQTCQRFDLLTYGKLALLVKPTFKEEIIISQRRAPEFKNWLEQNAA